jgi:hypothetical protein
MWGRRNVKTVWLFLLALVLLPSGIARRGTFGIHQEVPIALAPYLSANAQLRLLKNTGATSLRQRMRWNKIEPEPGQYDWSTMDAAVEGLVGAGIDPLIVLRDTPAWAADPTCESEDVSTCPPVLDAWTGFVTTAVERYRGRVESWEIWNEPNTSKMWAGTVQDYYLLLKAAYAAIHSADPDARVVIGGMTHDSVLDQGDWLRTLLGAPDIDEYFDVFSFHLYGTVGQPEETFESLNALLDEFGLSGKEIWVTETNPQMLSEQQQADALEDWFERILMQGATRVYYFTLPNWCGDRLTWDVEWCDANVYSLAKPTGGLVHNVDFTPTLVYDAFQRMAIQKVYLTRLAGDELVPPVDSASTAVDLFSLNQDGGLLRHVLAVTNIKFATGAHIHCGSAGANGPVGVTLYDGRPQVIKAGILAKGPISEPDPGNQCGWEDLDDLAAAMNAGLTYVTIETLAHPEGEVRGQIR